MMRHVSRNHHEIARPDRITSRAGHTIASNLAGWILLWVPDLASKLAVSRSNLQAIDVDTAAMNFPRPRMTTVDHVIHGEVWSGMDRLIALELRERSVNLRCAQHV